MAEELYDGEFWLPSQILSDDDDDFLSDFSKSGSGFGSCSTSEPETSDDDDLLLLLLPGSTRQFSPKSTLFGCDSNNPGSSLSSPTLLVSPPKEEGGDTWNLLNKAAGEVAKMKIRSEKTSSSIGTGFFDCSNTAKRLLCPPQPPPPANHNHFPPPVYFYPHFRRFPPNMTWGAVQAPPPQQNRVTKNNSSKKSNNNNNGNNCPLGLPPSAWPALPAQAQSSAQSQPQTQPMMSPLIGPKRESVGTGVFLPRRVASPVEPKKKSDGIVVKTKNNKGSQRRNSYSTKENHDEIQLPSEWVY